MFDLIVVSDEQKYFDGKASEVQTITENGPLAILSQHEPFLAKIKDTVRFKPASGEQQELKISEGFLYTNGKLCFVVIG